MSDNKATDKVKQNRFILLLKKSKIYESSNISIQKAIQKKENQPSEEIEIECVVPSPFQHVSEKIHGAL